MAKLRDTAIKDNLAIAGNVTAAGKVLSVEGHTHTPANITGIDKYIEDKVKAGGATLPENINAKTLDGHAASDFVLKTESINTNEVIYSYKKTMVWTSANMKIAIPESMSKYIIKITDNASVKTLTGNGNRIIEFTKFPHDLRSNREAIPTWYFNDKTFYITGIMTDNTVLIEVISSTPITEELKITPEPNTSNYNYFFVVDNCTYTNLGYKIYDNLKNENCILFKPTELLVSNYNTNTLALYNDFKILDFDNNLIIRSYYGSVYMYNPNNVSISIDTIANKDRSIIFINGLSRNILVISNNGFAFYVDKNISNTFTPSKDNGDISLLEFSLVKMKELLSSNSISATINGVQFDGKTNITTPATKLITPVHINGIEFDGSQDITIPAPTNALTLGGLDSSQYIKATDVGNAAGKIPRFDNDGFLVYPDGSKERIENG